MIRVTAQIAVNDRIFNDYEAAVFAIESRLTKEVERGVARVGREILRSLKQVATKLRETHSNPWNGRMVNDTNKLQRRSGDGLKSILQSIRQTNGMNVVGGQITTGSMGAIHETGGIIAARRSKYLTIPLPAALDSRGLPKKAKARDWEDTFVARSQGGSLLIFQKKMGKVVPLYLLKSSVRIPARLGLGKTINDELPHFERRAFEALDKEFGL